MEQFIATLPDFFKNLDIFKFLGSISWIFTVIYFALSIFFALKTYDDAKKRIKDKLLVYILTLFMFFFHFYGIGYILYSIIRPKDYINDQHMLKLEKYFLEYETRGIGKCKVCRTVYYPEHTYCINCGQLVRAKCNACSNVIELDWKVCPYCGDKKNIDNIKLKAPKPFAKSTQ
jgi:RNA polymerase subunit RPABC4/transcription elongation factor Spt4